MTYSRQQCLYLTLLFCRLLLSLSLSPSLPISLVLCACVCVFIKNRGRVSSVCICSVWMGTRCCFVASGRCLFVGIECPRPVGYRRFKAKIYTICCTVEGASIHTYLPHLWLSLSLSLYLSISLSLYLSISSVAILLLPKKPKKKKKNRVCDVSMSLHFCSHPSFARLSRLLLRITPRLFC